VQNSHTKVLSSSKPYPLVDIRLTVRKLNWLRIGCFETGDIS